MMEEATDALSKSRALFCVLYEAFCSTLKTLYWRNGVFGIITNSDKKKRSFMLMCECKKLLVLQEERTNNELKSVGSGDFKWRGRDC